MDAENIMLEVVKKNWQLIDLVANHDYIPNGAAGAVNELASAYHSRVDTWCGACIVSMFKWYYQNFKDKI